MADRNPPWYQREPYPVIVEVLIGHGVLREGGTKSLQFASRILGNESDPWWRGDPIGAIAAQIVAEMPHVAIGTIHAAARDLVDVLALWREGATS